MRYFAILSVLFLFSFTKSASDKKLILGAWSLYELKDADGNLTYSANETEQKRITDKTVEGERLRMEEAGYDEATLREMIAKQCEAISQTTLVFDEKGTAKTSGSPSGITTESGYSLDEKNKMLKMISKKSAEVSYTYVFIEDKLVMKSLKEEITLQKKK